MDISFTDFVDFLSSTGTSRAGKVRKLKERGGYEPRRDYYKAAREAIREAHENGNGSVDIEELLSRVKPAKHAHYEAVVDGHRRFIGRKKMEFFAPPNSKWGHDDLSIRVNPELGLIIAGVPHVIKLYFKPVRLSKSKAGIISHTMETALRKKAGKKAVMGVLDLRDAKLYTPSTPIPDGDVLLAAEALAFIHLWNEL